MSLLRFLRRPASAKIARERLQLLLTHERLETGRTSDLIAVLREEILAVIAKHIAIDSEKVLVTMNRGEAVCTLTVDIDTTGDPTKAAA